MALAVLEKGGNGRLMDFSGREKLNASEAALFLNIRPVSSNMNNIHMSSIHIIARRDGC
jgi:hypothetical protein